MYRKRVNTGQILNQSSNNRRTREINYVQSLFKGKRTHCSTLTTRKSEEKYLKTIFRKNGYSIKFIRKYQHNSLAETKASTKISKRIIVPFVKDKSEIATILLKPFGWLFLVYSTIIIVMFFINDTWFADSFFLFTSYCPTCYLCFFFPLFNRMYYCFLHTNRVNLSFKNR